MDKLQDKVAITETLRRIVLVHAFTEAEAHRRAMDAWYNGEVRLEAKDDERYTVGKYNTMMEQGGTPEEALDKLRMMSRDNVRTPMQWDHSVYAGFSLVKPWMKVNPNHPISM